MAISAWDDPRGSLLPARLDSHLRVKQPQEETHAVAYEVDPEVAAALAVMAAQSGAVPAPARGDWQALRERGSTGLAYMATLVPPASVVQTSTFATTALDGAAIELQWYTKQDTAPGSAVVYAHGGGMITGDLDGYDAVFS